MCARAILPQTSDLEPIVYQLSASCVHDTKFYFSFLLIASAIDEPLYIFVFLACTTTDVGVTGRREEKPLHPEKIAF